MVRAVMDPSHVAAMRAWSWGALFLTPLWLFRNGFWITAVVCGLLWFALPLLAIPFSVLFFLFGARWSWGDGQRWESFEAFESSQWHWNVVGIISGVSYLLVGLFVAAPFLRYAFERA